MDDNLTSIFLLFEELPGLVLSAVMVDKLGRKLSMSLMFFLGAIFLFPLAFYRIDGLTTSLLFGARICITSTFTVVYIYAPEVSWNAKLHCQETFSTPCITTRSIVFLQIYIIQVPNDNVIF